MKSKLSSKYAKSTCCGSLTRIGYYSNDGIANMGTYCSKCDKLCTYHYGDIFYYTNGDQMVDIKLIRKLKLNEIEMKSESMVI